jgi:excisionase family DNA binding protein
MPRHTPASLQHEQATKAQSASSQEDTLYTVSEVAKRLRVDTTTVRRWIAIGILEAVVLPHQGKRQAYRIRESTLNKLLQTPASTLVVSPL